MFCKMVCVIISMEISFHKYFKERSSDGFDSFHFTGICAGLLNLKHGMFDIFFGKSFFLVSYWDLFYI